MSDYNSSEENSFRDLYERDNDNRFERSDSLIQKEQREIPKKEEPKKKGKSFVEMLTGDEDIGNFARQLNLDPELSEKLLVPLLSLLDKYNIGENVTANPRVESAVGAFEVIRDVAPVIKGAAEFVSGKKAELEADDMAYLEAIRQSQSVTDASLFEDGDDLFIMTEEEEVAYEAPAPAPQAPAPAFGSFGANDWNSFFSEATGQVEKDPLDNSLTRELEGINNAVNAWANQQTGGINVAKQNTNEYADALSIPSLEDMTTGMPNTIAEMIDTQFAIVDVGQLAQESGLSVNAVMEGDSQRKINNQEQEEFNDEPFDLTELQPEEKEFEVDYSIVPDDAEEYDPFTVAGFDIPTFSATDIEEVNEASED